MIDNSRNAVMQPSTVKKMIDIMEKLDYNTLMLYTEDTYEVNNQPYFGYMRGRYSKSELKELDAYAKQHHIEMIPCVQTLAHLNAIMRWPHYAEIRDCDDILCAGEEKVYELIEDMFATLDECFTSRIVNVGMDEAEMVGLGNYLKKHGYCERVKILSEHLSRVAEIAERYDFTLCMWSDMFFKLATGSYYEAEQIDVEVAALIPKNVRLIYWDYYSTEKEHYDKMILQHQKLQENILFAGGIWTWMGFAPHNAYSIETAKVAVQSCLEHGVGDVFFTMWGDNGGECSRFSVLPALFYNACLGKGITDDNQIKSQFYDMFGISFDDFMLLDLPDTPNGSCDEILTADKYTFYNDCFMGLFDRNVHPDDAKGYQLAATKLAKYVNHTEWGYLFKTMKDLCEVNASKCMLGLHTREAYVQGDREKLTELLSEYQDVFNRVQKFYDSFEKQWMIENKPHGFDVQDIRIGGLLQRIKHCKNRLEKYIKGELASIPELEEQLLDVRGMGADTAGKAICFNGWNHNVTANIL